MYEYISGALARADTKTAVIDCGGVGYKCFISAWTYRKIYDKPSVKLYTYLNVKEDAFDLYGFADEGERELFLLLTTVSGVGPKVALSVLSELESGQIVSALLSGNYKPLTSASGVGPKMAQRMCLELRDKIKGLSVGAADEIPSPAVLLGDAGEAVEVLVALGYSPADAKYAVGKCAADNTNDIVKQALRILAPRA